MQITVVKISTCEAIYEHAKGSCKGPGDGMQQTLLYPQGSHPMRSDTQQRLCTAHEAPVPHLVVRPVRHRQNRHSPAHSRRSFWERSLLPSRQCSHSFAACRSLLRSAGEAVAWDVLSSGDGRVWQEVYGAQLAHGLPDLWAEGLVGAPTGQHPPAEAKPYFALDDFSNADGWPSCRSCCLTAALSLTSHALLQLLKRSAQCLAEVRHNKRRRPVSLGNLTGSPTKTHHL